MLVYIRVFPRLQLTQVVFKPIHDFIRSLSDRYYRFNFLIRPIMLKLDRYELLVLNPLRIHSLFGQMVKFQYLLNSVDVPLISLEVCRRLAHYNLAQRD